MTIAQMTTAQMKRKKARRRKVILRRKRRMRTTVGPSKPSPKLSTSDESPSFASPF